MVRNWVGDVSSPKRPKDSAKCKVDSASHRTEVHDGNGLRDKQLAVDAVMNSNGTELRHILLDIMYQSGKSVIVSVCDYINTVKRIDS